jgi:type II secretory pathway pseudopilin PulG
MAEGPRLAAALPRRGRSEAGDTLIEVLLAIVVLGIAAVAILLAFATSLSGTGEHRTLATFDTALRTVSEEATSQIQQQTTTVFASCGGAAAVQFTNLPSGYTALITSTQYWNGTSFVSGSCIANAPELITIKVTSKTGLSYNITTVVDDPLVPALPTVGTASQLIFLQAPLSATAGVSFTTQPQVAIEDANGVIVRSDLSFLTLAINAVNGSTPTTLSGCSGTEFAGVVSFTGCSTISAGTYTLTATDGSLTKTSTLFVVSAGIAAQMSFASSPSASTAASVAFATQPVIDVLDAFGNIVTTDSSTVGVAITPGTGTTGAVLSGCSSSESTGATTFAGCKINLAGSGYTLTATDGSLPSVTSNSFAIVSGVATQMSFTTSPSASTAATVAFATQPVVTLKDAFGNVATTDSSTVTLSITSGTGTSGAVLSGCSGTENAGVVTFSGCAINKLGTGYTLTASDGSISPAHSNSFAITVGAPSQLVFTSVAVTGTASNSATLGAITVQEQDSGGNPTTTAETVNLSSSSTGSAHFATSSNGTSITSISIASGSSSATFYYGDTKAGAPVITASATGLTAGTQTETINAGTATKLAITTQPPSSTGGGTSFGVGVSVEDALSNVVTTSSASVSLAIGTNPSSGILTCATNPVSASSGLTTFSCSINKPGAGYTLTATASSLTSATTSSFTITTGPAAKLVVTTQPPASATAGANFTTAVSVEDAGGNVVTTSSALVALAIATNPSTGSLTCTTNPVTASSGVATFSCSINKAGAGYTLTATSGSLTSATTTATTINAGAASRFVITSNPVTGVASNSATLGPITVQEQDSQGNPTTTAETVNLSSNSTGTARFATSSGGSAVTSVSILSGSSSTTFFYGDNASGFPAISVSGSLTTGSQSETITAAGATKLVVTTAPSASVGAGTSIPVGISVEDTFGNVVSSSSAQVTLAIGTNPGGSTLSCTTNPLNASGGVATFGCSLNKPASGYTLTATSSGLTSVTTGTFAIVPGTPTQLSITTQPPASSTAGTAFTVAGTLKDALGNVATNASTPVTLAIGTNPGGGTLSCTTNPVTPSSGIATFSCSVNRTGTGYTLTASASGTGGATTSSFNITAGTASKLAFTSTAFTATASTSATSGFTVTLQDALGNPTTKTTATTVNLTSTSSGKKFATSSGGSSVTSVTLAANTSSVSAFYGDTVAQSPTLTASGTSLTSGTQSETVVAAAPSKFVFTSTAVSGTANTSATLGPITVQEQDTFGNATTKAETVNLTSTDSSTDNYALSSGGASITSVAIPSGSSSASFFFGDTHAGTPTITASGALTSATQNETINAGAGSQLGFSFNPSSATASSTTNVTVTLLVEDQFGNATTNSTGNSQTVTVSSSSAGGFFATSSGASGTLGGTINVTIANGASSASTFYGDETAGSPTLTAAISGFSLGSGTPTITAGAPAGLALTNASTSAGSGPSCGAVSSSDTCTVSGVGSGGNLMANVSFVDAFGNPTVESTSGSSSITLTKSSGTLSVSSLTVAKNTTTSSSQFKLTLSGTTTSTLTIKFGSTYTLTVTVSH